MKKNRKIIWNDHASPDETWMTLEDIKKWAEKIVKNPNSTYGNIIYETKDFLIVSGEDDGEGKFSNCTLIWKKLIRR